MNQDIPSPAVAPLVTGVDLGDLTSHVCILDGVTGEVVEEARIRTRPKDMQNFFGRHGTMRVAIEVGTHSAWSSRAIASAGHEVTIANAARVRLIHGGQRKNDKLDAEKLARLLRYDRNLLSPIQHRSESSQHAMAVLRSRVTLIRAHTMLVNHVRGVMKSFGLRVAACSTKAFADRARQRVPPELMPALEGQLLIIESLTVQIHALDLKVRDLCNREYPVTGSLMQVHGVAEITALTFILSIEDPTRFERSRDVAAYLGLVPGQRQSGGSDPTRRITKSGDRELRRLLVQCAQRILGKRGSDSDLKRHGERIASSGSKDSKRRAVVAVARKLAVLLHRLWLTGEAYEPLRNSKRKSPVPA